MTTNNALNLTYEEKTWMPILSFGGNSTGIVYTKQSANYIQLGKLIIFSAQINLSNKGNGSGEARINLPFASKKETDYSCNVTTSHMNYSNSKTLKGYIEAGASYLTVILEGPSSSKAKGDHSMFNNNSEINATGRYFIT